MVEWYNPWQLLKTGFQVAVWEFVAQGRPMEESARSPDIWSFGDRELWFDYTADVADGWNSTFAIASLIAQPSLQVAGRTLPHGEFLLLGGDEVYPVPTLRSYRDRLVAPYAAALPEGSLHARPLFAIPGNHDWYDGLVSFSRQFTQFRPIGGWRTIQAQSFFALQLPQRWWLWAMDVQGGSHMDYGQRTYFRGAASRLREGDHVILAAAEPDWVTREPAARDYSHYTAIEQEFIEPQGATVHLWLAGDRHHYRRHERRNPDGTTDPDFQRITSGGGGAFLFPTHHPIRRNVVVGDQEFVQKTRFPSAVTSFRLSWLNLLFAVKNWKVGVYVMGVLYWLLTWVPPPPGWPAPSSWPALFGSPGMLMWVFVILIGFVVYADRESPWFRGIGGLAHGFAHAVTAIAVTGMVNASFLVGAVSIWDRLAAHVLNYTAGVVFGPTLLGLYLFLSLNLFGFHALEAFSSLRIPDYKHFLRLHIGADGRLEIFPIAIRKVPRRDEGRGRYMLIEEPVTILDPTRPSRAAFPPPAVDFTVRG
jgi:hypothetical protein